MSWLSRLWFQRARNPEPNGAEARRATVEAVRKRRQASRDWADVREAREDLASWIDTAMGRGKTS